MKQRLLFLSLFLILSSVTWAEIKVSGALRNDMIFTYATNDTVLFNSSLESRLILTRKAEGWRFYSDIRAWAYVGSYTNVYGPLRLDIMRVFGRIYTDAGDVTIGKQYVNLGNLGIFNPFEMDKNVNMQDLTYDKAGLLGASWDFVFSDLAGGVIYARPEAALSNSGGGIAFKFNAGSFDLGLVYNRKGLDQHVAGVYFKGDLGVGINGAYAYHLNDLFEDPFHELSLGLDYSFFTGKLFLSITAYYCDIGAADTSQYVNPLLLTDDRFFQAHTYMSSTLSYAPNEFLNFGLESFYNLVDGSMIFLPNVKFTVINGFTLTALAVAVPREGDREFSRDNLGPVSLLLRAELKL